ncbi:MAG TPA: hypothetical protein VL281_01755 [Mycobacteriales bacterium]|nr:hypothetical protein [Mycobacteriales bacterium]
MTLISLGAGELLQNDEVDTHWYDGLARRVSRPVQALRGVPHLGTWVGLLIAAAGAVLLVIAWARTAALTDVGLQVPYVVSAGLTGLGLVVVGMTVVSISAKVEDARERTRQLGELRELLAELRSAVEDQQ